MYAGSLYMEKWLIYMFIARGGLYAHSFSKGTCTLLCFVWGTWYEYSLHMGLMHIHCVSGLFRRGLVHIFVSYEDFVCIFIAYGTHMHTHCVSAVLCMFIVGTCMHIHRTWDVHASSLHCWTCQPIPHTISSPVYLLEMTHPINPESTFCRKCLLSRHNYAIHENSAKIKWSCIWGLLKTTKCWLHNILSDKVITNPRKKINFDSAW